MRGVLPVFITVNVMSGARTTREGYGLPIISMDKLLQNSDGLFVELAPLIGLSGAAEKDFRSTQALCEIISGVLDVR